ncbi:MAG: PilX N-terminal domain-containing pilus assembly protein [Candidatus Saccharimonadales bacterium]
MYKALNSRSRAGQEDGFVSIFSVVIIMAILTLITIGFTNVTRRAQRNTLDNQQNTQAFYAAESGVNDAVRLLKSDPAYTKATCDAGDPAYFKYDLNAATGVGYTCVLVDSTPPTQSFDSVPTVDKGEPVITTLASENGATIQLVRIEWDSPNGIADPVALATPSMSGNIANLPDARPTGWGSRVGILRVDLVPDTSVTRKDLADNSYTFFLMPSNNGAIAFTAVAGSDGQGSVFVTNCSQAPPVRCMANVTLNNPGTINRYRMRMTSYYRAVDVSSIKILNAGSVLEQKDGQALIDSTGKAVDVFRRIQVTVPLRSVVGYHEPFSILAASDICKRLLTAPPNFAQVMAPAAIYPSCAIPPL